MKKVLLRAKYAGYKAWRVLSLDDSEADEIVAKGIAEFVEEEQPNEPAPDSETLPTFDAFSDMKADEQNALLERLKIVGDASNKEKRIALYAAYLAGDSNDDQSDNGADSGANSPGGSESTPEG